MALKQDFRNVKLLSWKLIYLTLHLIWLTPSCVLLIEVCSAVEEDILGSLPGCTSGPLCLPSLNTLCRKIRHCQQYQMYTLKPLFYLCLNGEPYFSAIEWTPSAWLTTWIASRTSREFCRWHLVLVGTDWFEASDSSWVPLDWKGSTCMWHWQDWPGNHLNFTWGYQVQTRMKTDSVDYRGSFLGQIPNLMMWSVIDGLTWRGPSDQMQKEITHLCWLTHLCILCII